MLGNRKDRTTLLYNHFLIYLYNCHIHCNRNLHRNLHHPLLFQMMKDDRSLEEVSLLFPLFLRLGLLVAIIIIIIIGIIIMNIGIVIVGVIMYYYCIICSNDVFRLKPLILLFLVHPYIK